MRTQVLVLTYAVLFGLSSAAAQPERAPPDHLSWSVLDQMRWPAPQTTFHGYRRPVQRAMWRDVYPNGGVELYCRAVFDSFGDRAPRIDRLRLSLEHAYPADAAAERFGLATRTCRTAISGSHADRDRCEAATGDMHNLWPAYGRLNSSHQDAPYGVLEGEGTTNENYEAFCTDFERSYAPDAVLVEPTAASAGDLARSILYMLYVYCLPWNGAIDDPEHLLQWANIDPVDRKERDREQAIIERQAGSWNPLIVSHEGGEVSACPHSGWDG